VATPHQVPLEEASIMRWLFQKTQEFQAAKQLHLNARRSGFPVFRKQAFPEQRVQSLAR
jgi:hypothetical protein